MPRVLSRTDTAVSRADLTVVTRHPQVRNFPLEKRKNRPGAERCSSLWMLPGKGRVMSRLTPPSVTGPSWIIDAGHFGRGGVTYPLSAAISLRPFRSDTKRAGVNLSEP